MVFTVTTLAVSCFYDTVSHLWSIEALGVGCVGRGAENFLKMCWRPQKIKIGKKEFGP
jgi:hypothetical protein